MASIESSGKSAKIVIIGAGYAGLSAANALINKHGFNNVTILEALDRPGGRVFTTQIDNMTVEMGAQFIHSKEAETYKIMKKLNGVEEDGKVSTSSVLKGLKDLMSGHEEFIALKAGGKKMSITKLWKYFEFGEKLEDEMDKIPPAYPMSGPISEQDDGTQNEPVNASKIYRDKFEKKFGKLDSENRDACIGFNMLKDTIAQDFALNNWEDFSTLSFSWYNLEDEYVELSLKEKGYAALTEYLLRQLPHTVIRYSTHVLNVDWTNPEVEIKTASGETIKADHVIVTSSIGYLKQNHVSLFTPQLPQRKVQYIDSVGFGTMNKIFAVFETKFWPNTDMMYLIPAEDDESPESAISWLQVSEVSYKQDNIIEVWISGPHVKELEILSDAELKAVFMKRLKIYFGEDVPNPTAFARTNWGSDPMFCGSYGHCSVQFEKLRLQPWDLIKPLSPQGSETPRVLFAGEATATPNFATVHGAYESGQREAARIAEQYDRKTSTGSKGERRG